MRRLTALCTAAMIALTSLSGCYGKMALTRKVYTVNGQVQDKYLRSLVTWVFIVVPVYGVSALADFVLFNTIEFWSGKNPVAQGEKDFLYAEGGEKYQVHATKQGDQVRYVVWRYGDGRLLDTLTIDWNLKDGGSSAVLVSAGRTTEYRAALEGGGVRVQSLQRTAQAEPLVQTAHYVR